MRIAVNLSHRRFQQHLAKTIARVLAETGLEPRYLEIEITESIAMHDRDYTISVLLSAGNGHQIAMDDFGISYIPLATLKHFPHAEVDLEFINDITTNQRQQLSSP